MVWKTGGFFLNLGGPPLPLLQVLRFCTVVMCSVWHLKPKAGNHYLAFCGGLLEYQWMPVHERTGQTVGHVVVNLLIRSCSYFIRVCGCLHVLKTTRRAPSLPSNPATQCSSPLLGVGGGSRAHMATHSTRTRRRIDGIALHSPRVPKDCIHSVGDMNI